MERLQGLWSSSVGKKVLMAVTGAVLVAFVIGHMIGNLKVFMGPEAFNHYAEGLRILGSPFFGQGQLLWLIRAFLLFSLIVHITAAVRVWLQSRQARREPYRRFDSLEFSYTSRTMVWGGITILAFVVYHLMHMTIGNVHPDFRPGDAYYNFVAAFQVLPVTLAYTLVMVPLGFHLYHGTWSALQTLGANNPRYNRFRRPLALAVALWVVLGFAAGPLAVSAGVVR